MCNYPIYNHLDHLELFSKVRTGITNVLEGSLCYFNKGTSLIVYLPILTLPLVVLNGFNAWKWWIRYPAPTYINTLMYPLNFIRLAGVTGHCTCQGFGRSSEHCQFEFASNTGRIYWVYIWFSAFKLPGRSPPSVISYHLQVAGGCGSMCYLMI